MKKYLKFIIPIFIFFIGFSVNATGIVNLSCDNGTCEVLNRCDNSLYCSSSPYQANTIQFAFNNQNLDVDKTYHFNLYFNLQNNKNYGSPTVTDCTLILNGQLTTATRNSYRTNYRCSNDGCFSNYGSFMTYTMSTSVSDSTSAIRCYLNASFPLDHIEYTYNITSDQGSMINAMNGNTQNIINNDNNNANSNNNNRDYNTNRDIENRTTLFNGLQQTLSNILQTMQDKLNDVKTGISNVINTIGGGIQGTINSMRIALDSVLSTLQGLGQSIAEDLSSIISGITTGFSNLGNKLSQMIGLSESCFIIDKDDIIQDGNFNSSGTILDSSSYGVTDFIDIYNSKSISYSSIASSYSCFYKADKTLISCFYSSGVSIGDTVTIPNDSYYLRATIRKANNAPTFKVCKGSQGIFSSFIKFVKDLFNNTLGLNRIGTVLNNHRNILDNSAFDSLSDFIHSPINFIHSLESTSCTGLNLTVFNQNITLPSGCIFWSREDVSSFRDFWNLLFGGLLIYRMGYRLFKALNDSIDPTKDDLGGLDI